ncbi:MAG: hypothetical protein JO025_07090 [Verrucomicrobia bacterium]|nr:hypothetical protein [Verrucomicrobiota bacterium]
MNVDYGFSQLFTALKSVRDNDAAWVEEGSVIEQKLPHINYSLLRSLNVHQYRYQPSAVRPERFHIGIATALPKP